MTAQKADQYSEEETAKRRDATIKRMLATPPKPHSEMRVGKKKGEKKTHTPPRRKKPQAKYFLGLSDILSDTPAPMSAVMRENSRALKEITNKSRGSRLTTPKPG